MAIVLPLILVGLFQALKGNQAAMDWWVFGVMAPVEQWLGRVWSVFPRFSVGELMIACVLIGGVVWLIWTVVLVILRRDGRQILRRTLAFVAAVLWIWAAFCWMWNAAYGAASFQERSGLQAEMFSVEELTQVTAYFAQQAADYSTQVPRNEAGLFDEDMESLFDRGADVYCVLSAKFPCLDLLPSVSAKPLFCSRLQSILGFTGMYFPFTGEANVNIDAPECLVPATIAHEMAHQRMVASELEANFVGIAACVTSGDVSFQYSGYLMGLLQLCNALYPVDAQAWRDIVAQYFTPQLAADWNDNNAYWAALESPLEDAAEQAYDSFLKGNGQTLGVRSYGACVDLLVAYFGSEAALVAEEQQATAT